MRAAPAFQVVVRRFWLSRIGVATLTIGAGVVAGTWLRVIDHELPTMARLSLAVAVCVAIALAASLWRRPSLSLRWDGQKWHVGPAASVGNEPWPGRLVATIDLDFWMLLRFDREAPGLRSPLWIGAQRRGLEHEWHALRCAVYSPRPDSVVPPVQDSSSLASTRPRPAE